MKVGNFTLEIAPAPHVVEHTLNDGPWQFTYAQVDPKKHYFIQVSYDGGEEPSSSMEGTIQVEVEMNGEKLEDKENQKEGNFKLPAGRDVKKKIIRAIQFGNAIEYHSSQDGSITEQQPKFWSGVIVARFYRYTYYNEPPKKKAKESTPRIDEMGRVHVHYEQERGREFTPTPFERELLCTISLHYRLM